jgi:fatty-acyl-CoA synthase
MGEVWLRGPWIADEYYHDPRTAETFQDGWYRSGDVAAIDAEGYLRIVDRMKDVIKSGGEWISTVDLENAIMAHPKVAEAAVVGVEHPKWQERPLACVVVKPGQSVTTEEILEHLKDKFTSWWLPDDVVLIDEVPKTSVGKFDKKVLRQRYAAYLVQRGTAPAR